LTNYHDTVGPTVFAQNSGWAVLTQNISKKGNSEWAMPTLIISRVSTCPPCPPSAGAHGVWEGSGRGVGQILNRHRFQTFTAYILPINDVN